jgi:superfamily I DNA/RNA helicase
MERKVGKYFNGFKMIEGPHVSIDYTDMLYIPLIKKYAENSPIKYKYILIDESQDLSVAKYELLKALLEPNGYMFFFGDRFQCINQYAGSTTQLFDSICNQSEVFNISITRRCSKNVVNFINNKFPHINMVAFENNPDGSVQTIEEKNLISNIRSLSITDKSVYVLHLNNLAIFELYLKLLKQNIMVNIMGNDIYENIITLLEKSKDINDLKKQINMKMGKIYKKLKSHYPNLTVKEIKSLQDYQQPFQAIRIFKTILFEFFEINMDNTNSNTITLPTKELQTKLKELFKTQRKTKITLSTIHKSKGQEADSVFLLDYPSIENNQTMDPIQANNLHFVALSRTILDLYLVKPAKNKKQPENNE